MDYVAKLNKIGFPAERKHILTSGLSRDNICMVGDRLYTDIALGKKNNMLSILVMTGETTKEMLDKADGDNIPDLVFEKISDIPIGK